jgi:nucleoside-diphosphate-sugar epimerase
MKVLVTGGCGYKGSVLVPKLLDAGHGVRVVDAQWFGNHLAKHPSLSVEKADFRNVSLDGVDAIIHLAAVANDPQGDLDPKLTWEINALGTMQLADRAARVGVKRFIYASSGSVYGVNEKGECLESTECVPISEYNKTKMVAERVLLSYAEQMCVQIVRPATVCGYSPRMRLDISINGLVMQALEKGEITVYGGQQMRPNIHIEDVTDLYLFMLSRPWMQGVYNAGFEGYPIMQFADAIAERTGATIKISDALDPRSYRMNSDKLLTTGFAPKRKVEDAIADIADQFHLGSLRDHDNCHNIRSMPR